MEVRELESFIIESRAKGVPLNHIKYLLEKDHEEFYDEDSLIKLEKALKDKIKIQKEINEEATKEDVKKLILKLNGILNRLTNLIDKASSEKITIMAIQQINSVITTIARLTGELKQQQEVNINKFYIKITDVRNYLKQNVLEFADDLPSEVKKKLVRRLKDAGKLAASSV